MIYYNPEIHTKIIIVDEVLERKVRSEDKGLTLELWDTTGRQVK